MGTERQSSEDLRGTLELALGGYLSRVHQFTKGPGETSPASSHQLVRAVSIGTGTLRDEGLRRWALMVLSANIS